MILVQDNQSQLFTIHILPFTSNLLQFKKSVKMSIPLISFDGKHFRITQQAKQFFEEIKQVQQLAVVSIIGKSKTGKSYFMNNVLLDSPQFQITHTTKPCTKGIWISKKLLDSPTIPGLKIMVMDVEGLGGIQDNSINDNRIILLPLIFSSYLIYNSIGYITEEAIRGLGVVVGFAQQLQTKEKLLFSLPFFHWIIRDFTLQLMNNEGYPITEKQYLERSLQEQKGLTQSIQTKNKIRRKFKQFFKQRDCSTLIRPYNQSMSELRQQFQIRSQEIKKKILSSIQCKQIKNIKLNPITFFHFVETILLDVNNGICPNIQNSWKIVYLQHEKNLLSKLEYLMFDEVQHLKQEDLSMAYINIKFKFQQMFSKESFCSNHPSVEIQNQIDKILFSIKRQVQDKANFAQQQKINRKLEEFYKELKQMQTTKHIDSVYELEGEIQRIIKKQETMFQKIDYIRTNKIKEKIKLILIQELCHRLELSNRALKDENNFFKRKSAQDQTCNQKLEQEIRQIEGSIVQMKRELQQKVKQKDIIIRNLQQQLHTKKIKMQQHVEQICLLNQKLNLVQNCEEYSRTLKRLQQLEMALLDMEKELHCMNGDQSKLKGDNFILKQQKYQLQLIIEKLNSQAELRQEQIIKTEKRIVQQVQKQQQRIGALLQEADIKDKEKDQRIQKLQRIIKQLKSRPKHVQQVCKINELKQQLESEKMRSRKLQKCLQEQKQIYEAKINNVKHPQMNSHKSAVMNLQLTSKGFKMKSFKSPPKLKQWQKEKICLQTQISLQQQLNRESKTLITALLSKEETYLNEISSLKSKLSQSYIESDFSSIKSAKGDKNKSILNNNIYNNISVSVPSFTIKTLENGHSITEYQLEFQTLDNKWKNTIRYRNFEYILAYLSKKYPQASEFKPQKSTKAEDKRKFIEKTLKQLLLIHQFRGDEKFKNFIQGKQSSVLTPNKLVDCSSQQNISVARFGSPSSKFSRVQSNQNIELRSGNKNGHFSIYIDS